MLVVLGKMVMLVLLMMVGFGAAKFGWIDRGFSRMASKLVMNVFIVCTILNSVANVEPSMTGGELGISIVAVFLMFFIGGILGFFVSRLLPLKKEERNVAWLSVFFMNNVFIGFPLVQAIFGEEAIFCASLSNIPFNLLLYTIGVSVLRSGEGFSWKRALTPPLFATLFAIVIFLFHIPIPQLGEDLFSTLGAATVPMSMIIIGVSLSAAPIRAAFSDWRAYVLCFVRLLLCPLVAFAVMRLFVANPLSLGVFTVQAACPSAAMVTILCVEFGMDDGFASKVNFLSTVLCVLTLPLMTYFLL